MTNDGTWGSAGVMVAAGLELPRGRRAARHRVSPQARRVVRSAGRGTAVSRLAGCEYQGAGGGSGGGDPGRVRPDRRGPVRPHPDRRVAAPGGAQNAVTPGPPRATTRFRA